MLRGIMRDFVNYMRILKPVLQNHLSFEYEVQLREGIVTQEGQNIISKLKEDFCILQYENKIKAITVASELPTE